MFIHMTTVCNLTGRHPTCFRRQDKRVYIVCGYVAEQETRRHAPQQHSCEPGSNLLPGIHMDYLCCALDDISMSLLYSCSWDLQGDWRSKASSIFRDEHGRGPIERM